MRFFLIFLPIPLEYSSFKKELSYSFGTTKKTRLGLPIKKSINQLTKPKPPNHDTNFYSSPIRLHQEIAR
ncbi:hypothetical protein DBR43_21365 [Pedobacter sp. KBW06]|nr:hypothetical protein DBR43_21365 [Pedobacter sp. KBW06]